MKYSQSIYQQMFMYELFIVLSLISVFFSNSFLSDRSLIVIFLA